MKYGITYDLKNAHVSDYQNIEKLFEKNGFEKVSQTFWVTENINSYAMVITELNAYNVEKSINTLIILDLLKHS